MENSLRATDQTSNRRKTTIGPNYTLKREREQRGWSQALVAEKIGAQSKMINRWETGSSFPSPYYREKLSQVFEKGVEELGLVKSTISASASERHLCSQLQLSETSSAEIPIPRSYPQYVVSPQGAIMFVFLTGIIVGIGCTYLWLVLILGRKDFVEEPSEKGKSEQFRKYQTICNVE